MGCALPRRQGEVVSPPSFAFDRDALFGQANCSVRVFKTGQHLDPPLGAQPQVSLVRLTAHQREALMVEAFIGDAHFALALGQRNSLTLHAHEWLHLFDRRSQLG